MLLLLVSRWRPGLSRSGRVGLSLAILAGGIAAGHVLSYQVLGASRSHPSKYMLVDDLFHLSLVRNRSLLPGVSLEHIQECAARDFGGSRLVGRAACLVREKGYRADDPAYAQLAGPWLAAILASPGDYIRFRLAAFGYLLRSPDVAPFYIWHPGIDDNGMGIIQRHNGLTVLAERLVKQTAAVAPFVFKPYFWLWVGLMLLLFTLAVKPNAYTAIQQALLVSSILYVLGYLPLTPRADLRYVYWSVLATNLAGILTVLGFSANRLRQPRPGARRNLTLVALGLGMTIAIPNARTLLHVNGDAVMLANLAAPARALHTPVGSSDLQNEGAAYRVRGPDPFLVFEVPDADSARRRVLGFRFACLNPVSEPVLQLFWWGGSESGPREEQSLFFRPQAGVNAVVFKSGEGGRVTERLRGVRIDLSTPGACGAIAITEPALYALD
jgi:hypothetical protein